MRSERRPLTDIAIRTAPIPDRGQVEIWDATIPGFGIRISARARKSFVLVYRAQGRARRLTIGPYPSVTLATARARAHTALGQIAAGADPATDKVVERRRPTAESFEALVDEFIEKYAKPRNRNWQETQRILRREFVPRWGIRAVGSIKKGEVTEAIDRMVKRGSPGAATRTFAIVRRFFNWCVERGVLEVSPCHLLRAPTAQNSRDRVLSDDEVCSVWKAAATIGYPYGHIVQLLVLTAQRKGEVAGLRWSEFDSSDKLWSLERERTKSKRQHVVPLSPAALDIIRSVPRIDQQLLFPSVIGKGLVSGFSKWKARLDEVSGVSDWRLHDLRRTAATGMARLCVAPHVIERVLNHTSGILGGVAGIYNRFQYVSEMRDALEHWATHVEALLKPSNVEADDCRVWSRHAGALGDLARQVAAEKSDSSASVPAVPERGGGGASVPRALKAFN